MSDLAALRAREYPEPRDGIFLNAASWGLIPKSAIDEVVDLTRRRNRVHGFDEAELGAIQRRCRDAAARLIGGDRSEIALSPNTSFGVNLAAYLLREGEPGAVLCPEGEFPANVLPFRALERDGFEVRIIPSGPDGLPDEAALIAALDAPDVVALAISAVQFASGHRADLPAIGRACARAGVLFFVDAIQQLGVVPFDVEETGAHVVACGGQKWLGGPWGSGFTWIRGDVQERMPPPMVSWLATASGADFGDMLHYSMEWRGNARKFELATLGVQDYLGLARSIEVLEEVGVEVVQDHVLELHRPILDWIDSTPDARLISPREPGRRAGIITFEVDDVPGAAGALRDAGVVFSVREGAIRLAPHWYTSGSDIDEVVGLLEASAAG